MSSFDKITESYIGDNGEDENPSEKIQEILSSFEQYVESFSDENERDALSDNESENEEADDGQSSGEVLDENYVFSWENSELPDQNEISDEAIPLNEDVGNVEDNGEKSDDPFGEDVFPDFDAVSENKHKRAERYALQREISESGDKLVQAIADSRVTQEYMDGVFHDPSDSFDEDPFPADGDTEADRVSYSEMFEPISDELSELLDTPGSDYVSESHEQKAEKERIAGVLEEIKPIIIDDFDLPLSSENKHKRSERNADEHKKAWKEEQLLRVEEQAEAEYLNSKKNALRQSTSVSETEVVVRSNVPSEVSDKPAEETVGKTPVENEELKTTDSAAIPEGTAVTDSENFVSGSESGRKKSFWSSLFTLDNDDDDEDEKNAENDTSSVDVTVSEQTENAGNIPVPVQEAVAASVLTVKEPESVQTEKTVDTIPSSEAVPSEHASDAAKSEFRSLNDDDDDDDYQPVPTIKNKHRRAIRIWRRDR